MSPPDSPDGHQDKIDTNETIHSLGEALAGMNFGSSAPNSAFGSAAVSSSFAFGNNQKDAAWGNFAEASAQFTPHGNEHAAPGIEQHLRPEGLDLFLSKSPSETLGQDVFKLSHTNLPSLANAEEEQRNSEEVTNAFRFSGQSLARGPASAKSNFDGRTEGRRESPSCSVTGTTGTTSSSRSASPYNEGRSIQAYHRFDTAPALGENHTTHHSFHEDDSALNHGQGSHPSIPSLDTRSPFSNKERNSHLQIPGYERASSFTQQAGDVAQIGKNGANSAQKPQVLYMAVPAPDGRGQVLQPVQILQAQGKPYTYVMGNEQTQQPPSQQPMVALPSPHGEFGANSMPPVVADSRSRYDAGYAVAGLDFNAQYPTDAPVSSLYTAPQRPPLDQLLGQVRRLSRDQVGCRLVQQALDEEGPMAATLILNEGLPFWGEAMVDPFGNYLFQKILEKVTPEERVMLVKSVSPRLVNASLNLHGTRSVQKIVELCAIDEQHGVTSEDGTSASDVLTKALSPAAARLCIDSHGNHVIQRILLKLGQKHSKFIFDAVAASVGDVARHRHGCCVIQRCLDSPPSESRAHLVRRIVEKSLELMQDAYGNYVVQYVLDVCSDEDVQAVCESVVGKVNLLAIQKFSSNVMEKCLERCADRVKEFYLQEMSDPERIRELMMDPFGNYVVQRALSVATHAQAVRLVEAMRPHLIASQAGGPTGQRNGGVRNTAGGRRIIAKICRRFPNFTLSEVSSQEELYSQNKTNQPRQHSTPPQMMGGYAPVGTGSLPYNDPRMSQQMHMSLPPQQQTYYNVGGQQYYDHFGSGHGTYGM